MKTLFIINDPPYGTERVYNALRLALGVGILAVEMEAAVMPLRKQRADPGSASRM